MVSESAKQTINALSKEELQLEVNKGNRSRFQRDKFAYAKARLKQLDEEEQTEQHNARLTAATDANEIARQANTIATRALRMAILAVIVALLSVVVSMCSKG